MIRLAVTVWFTVAALLGPGLCCCLKVSAAEPVKKPAKSCCHTPTDESKAPAKPDPCPCQQAKATVEYAPAEKPTTDPGLMLTAQFVGVGPAEVLTTSVPTSVPADPFALTMRQRLALFHVLTC